MQATIDEKARQGHFAAARGLVEQLRRFGRHPRARPRQPLDHLFQQ